MQNKMGKLLLMYM